jgi:hypothetical protein
LELSPMCRWQWRGYANVMPASQGPDAKENATGGGRKPTAQKLPRSTRVIRCHSLVLFLGCLTTWLSCFFLYCLFILSCNTCMTMYFF